MADLQIIGQDDHYFSWRPADEGPMRRSAHALILDSGLWLVDPIDLPGLDARLAALGTVAGIIQTLPRHRRGAVDLAARHGVEIWADRVVRKPGNGVRTIEERIPNTPLLSVPLKGRGMRRWWREAAIWWPERRLAAVGESVGNPPYYLLKNERLGLHPMRRGQPPSELGSLDVDQLMCGHGDGIAANAGSVLRDVLEHGPRRKSLFWMFRTFRAYR